jgi:hypothetical protein
MPKIMERIAEVGGRMKNDQTESERIRKEAVDAIMQGRGKPAWIKYMENFATGDQLDRLIGQDPAFLESKYGETILAYVVAAGPCTLNTSCLRMALDMPPEMAAALDDGVTGGDA